MLSRYWFSTALGCVIIFAATVNYLNQPAESTATRPVAAASVAIERPTVAQAVVPDAEPEALARPGEPVAELVALEPVEEPIAADGEPGEETLEDAVARLKDTAKPAEPVSLVRVETGEPADAGEEAIEGHPVAAASSTGWLVETTGSLSADQVGRAMAGATPVAAQADISEIGVDDEVQAILSQTEAAARENLGMSAPLDGPAGEPPAMEVALGEAADRPAVAPATSGDVAVIAPDAGETDPTVPAWERHAAHVPPAAGPMVAVIIDDLGWSARRTGMVSALSQNLTLAMQADTPDAPRQAIEARATGHELLIHVAMQPAGDASGQSEGQLNLEMSEAELRQAVDAVIGDFTQVIGINNHMGSLFTSDPDSMQVVLEQVNAHGLAYIDSLTTPDSVADEIAAKLGMPYLRRDVFLDNERDASAIRHQLDSLERIANTRGYAVAIGHPYIETIDALASWIPTLERKGITLVPVSTLIRQTRTGTQTASRID